ncbi:GspH/FimT family pseudopilin [Shewanella surugensis]|uniref:Type II secretion system protein H n=1 Tax=Shewanella surugensis TaxID=212020 RepID=A0ABT0L5T6_9GAMM|nr:GspH/FimT family pseudopilin [Shewanella surugensis]MCL1123047.1 GspH/FimT family pseudopilin [Shewanella surugensis]
MKINHGFTLVELMTILAVATTLVLVAVPSLTAIYHHLRADSNIRHILQTLQLARNQAMNYGYTVTACPLIEKTCTEDWHQGIDVFFDNDQANKLDGDDKLIYQTGKFNDADFVTFNRTSIRFKTNGMASGTNGTLKYCPGDPSSSYSKAIIISQSGRVRFSSDTNISCE